MEKFRKFADAGTGKQPFLPAPTSPSFDRSVLDIVTGLPKMLVFVVFWLLYFIFSTLHFPILPRIFAKIMLILLGVNVRRAGMLFCPVWLFLLIIIQL